jgi:S-methylmethionine-dependent homocysteine/selenocysteine methylase
MGTELEARGIRIPGPRWTAHAVAEAPDAVASVHRDYVLAGADVHTTATFRTTPRACGADWRPLLRDAVAIARAVVPGDRVVAGSIAPLEDCWRPDLSPPDPEPELAVLAEALAVEGVDLLLCETFPHPAEALAAARAALHTGLPTWLSLTAGPAGDLLSPAQLARVAREAADLGVAAVLVNCVDARRIAPFVEALAGAGGPFGVYANAGPRGGDLGWGDPPGAPERYAALAAEWLARGAEIVGSCCGTRPAHTVALRTLLDGRGSPRPEAW